MTVHFGEKAAEKNLPAESEKVGKNVMLACGGGSVMDCCKVISAQAKTEEDLWELETVKHGGPTEFFFQMHNPIFRENRPRFCFQEKGKMI